MSERSVVHAAIWQSRKVISDAWVSDWFDLPEAGTTICSLEAYLATIYGHEQFLADISRERPDSQTLLQDMYDYQFRKKPL